MLKAIFYANTHFNMVILPVPSWEPHGPTIAVAGGIGLEGVSGDFI